MYSVRYRMYAGRCRPGDVSSCSRTRRTFLFYVDQNLVAVDAVGSQLYNVFAVYNVCCVREARSCRRRRQHLRDSATVVLRRRLTNIVG